MIAVGCCFWGKRVKESGGLIGCTDSLVLSVSGSSSDLLPLLLLGTLLTLVLLLMCLQLVAFIPGMALVGRLGVVFSTPGALLGRGVTVRCVTDFWFGGGGVAGASYLHVLRGKVHEPLVTLLIGEVVLGHQVILDVRH